MNKMIDSSNVIISIIFLWIGFVCAISFMEAWLKFQAPGVDLKIGLSIGKVVFKALNKVEWGLCFTLCISLFLMKLNIADYKYYLLLIPIIILCVQTIWLLPLLESRANAIIQNQTITQANYHIYFIVAEVIKVLSLLIISFLNFK
jgi:hypothetical protein